MRAIRFAALSALATVTGCAAPSANEEPVSWRLEREEHAARIRVFECREAVSRGARPNCREETAALAQAERARELARYSGVANAGAIYIE